METSQASDRHVSAPVSVVTVFLTSAGKVAVFRRSRRVGTYQGAWAGVSGYVERLPLEQAYVELREEVGLAAEQVELAGIGVPVIVDDEKLGRRWMVHPFLFELADRDAIRIDWEAEEVRWIEPAELADLETVPGLNRVLAAVWPPFGDRMFWEQLARVAVDTAHGATSLAELGLEALENYLARDSDAPLPRAARALAASRASMGIFPHLAARFLAGRVPIDQLRAEIEQTTLASASYAAKALRKSRSVLTNSYSSAVKQALLTRSGSGEPLEVTVAESRPELEGVALARELSAQAVRVMVITDAQTGLTMPEMDAVLVGCDAITAEDALQNKAGTSLMVLAARFHSVPCFAVTQTLKIVPPGFPHPVEEQNPDRVGHSGVIRFRNRVFDTTPLSLFDAVYTENGALTTEELSSVRATLAAARLV